MRRSRGETVAGDVATIAQLKKHFGEEWFEVGDALQLLHSATAGPGNARQVINRCARTKMLESKWVNQVLWLKCR